MTPSIKTLIYQYNKHGFQIELLFKKKDYGSMILYDIFYKSNFLFTLSADGRILMSNWEVAGVDPLGLDENMLQDVFNGFIGKQKASY